MSTTAATELVTQGDYHQSIEAQTRHLEDPNEKIRILTEHYQQQAQAKGGGRLQYYDERNFDSLYDLLMAAEPDFDLMKKRDRTAHSESQHPDSFTKVRNYQEAVDLARYGWPQGLTQALSLKEEIDRKVAEHVPLLSVTHDVSGDMVDVDRLINGDPEHMMEWQIRPIYTRVVTISVDNSVSGGVSANTIIARGAVIGSLVDAFERMRVPTSVKSYWRNNMGKSEMRYSLEVKRPGDTLDLNKLMFTIAHPAMYRRILFSLWENHPPLMRIANDILLGHGYGHVSAIPTELRADLHFDEQHSSKSQWSTPSKAVQFVLAQLDKAGIDLDG